MLGLFEAFSLKRLQLKQAVATGQDDLVCLLDKELEPMIADILAFKAQTRDEVRMQLQFVNGLIRDEADDRSSVTRRSAAMAMLIDRYFSASDVESQSVPAGTVAKPVAQPVEQPMFNEAVLDCLPDRVGVVTKDYRYLYSNQENARFLNMTPLAMIGRHVADFVGQESFDALARPAFDRCFSGENVDYIHTGCLNSQGFETRCRMTPLRGIDDQVIGAVIVLKSVSRVAALEWS